MCSKTRLCYFRVETAQTDLGALWNSNISILEQKNLCFGEVATFIMSSQGSGNKICSDVAGVDPFLISLECSEH